MTPAVQDEAADETWSKAVLHLLETANVLRTNGGGGVDPDRDDPAVSGLQERVDLGSGVFAVVVESHRAPGTTPPRGARCGSPTPTGTASRPSSPTPAVAVARLRRRLSSGTSRPTPEYGRSPSSKSSATNSPCNPWPPPPNAPAQAAHPPKHRRGTSTCAHQAVATLLMCQAGGGLIDSAREAQRVTSADDAATGAFDGGPVGEGDEQRGHARCRDQPVGSRWPFGDASNSDRPSIVTCQYFSACACHGKTALRV